MRRRRLERLVPVCGDRAVTVIFPSKQPGCCREGVHASRGQWGAAKRKWLFILC